MEWISIKDRLPNESQHCWICDDEKNVIDACYREKCSGFRADLKGFCVDEETGYYILIGKIKYWMPYYTPKPPK